jgi:hypothetical protein
MAYKPDFKPEPTRTANPEMTIKADPRLVSYSVILSKKLVYDYLAAHPVEKAHVSTALTPAELAASEVTSVEYEEWSLVNQCEELGNWHTGPKFSGLGISAANWIKYGGEQFTPTGMTATPDEQIVVAERIQENPPDQHGCQKGGW